MTNIKIIHGCCATESQNRNIWILWTVKQTRNVSWAKCRRLSRGDRFRVDIIRLSDACPSLDSSKAKRKGFSKWDKFIYYNHQKKKKVSHENELGKGSYAMRSMINGLLLTVFEPKECQSCLLVTDWKMWFILIHVFQSEFSSVGFISGFCWSWPIDSFILVCLLTESTL